MSIPKFSLKSIRNEIINLSKCGYSLSKEDLFKLNILYYTYIEKGGKRLVKIKSLKYILKAMELRAVYNKAKLNYKTKFRALDEVIRFVVFQFWKVISSGGIDIPQPYTKVTSEDGYEIVNINFDVVINGRIINKNIIATIEHINEYYMIEDLLIKLLLTTFELYGGRAEDFELFENIVRNLGYKFFDTILIKM